MKLKKLWMLLATTQLVGMPFGLAAGSDPVQILKNFTTNLQAQIDNWSAGIIPPYNHVFPKEDLRSRKSNYEFNNLIVLGDSISDPGSDDRLGRYIAGGYESPLYLDYLSEALTGKASAPATQGGLNYGEHGASIVRIEENRKSLEEIYQDLLKRFHGRLPKNSPVVIWGGNMDLDLGIPKRLLAIGPQALLSSLPFPVPHALIHLFTYLGDDLDAPDLTMKSDSAMNKAAQVAANIAQDLLKRGTPYVFVSNIPDGTLLPYSTMVFTELIVEHTLKYLPVPGFSLVPYTWVITWLGKGVDEFLRNPDNIIPAAGREFFRLNQTNAMAKRLPPFLHSLAVIMYDTMVTMQYRSTVQYNNTLERYLSSINGNVVYFDFASLFEEVAYHYKDYGLDTVLVPTCTLGYSSRSCDKGSPNYHKEISMFSDWFHPSPQLHLMIGQAMLAIFNAPLYVSAVARQADSINDARLFYLNNQLNTWRNQEVSQSPILFAGYSGSLSKSGVFVDRRNLATHLLNTGLYSYISPNWLVGGAISLGFGSSKPHQHLRYEYNNQAFSLFSQYSDPKGWWADLDISTGRLKANDIDRTTLIYVKELHNKGSTHLHAINVLGRLGWDVLKRQHAFAGSFVQVAFNRYEVNGYQEDGKKFLAMQYKDYTYRNNYFGLGGYYRADNLKLLDTPFSLSFESTLNRKIQDKQKNILRAGLATKSVLFNREIKNRKKTWLDAKVASDWQVGKHTQVSGALGVKSDLLRDHSFNYSIGFKSQF